VRPSRPDNLKLVHPCLVIENDPADDLRRLGEWLGDELDLQVLRAHEGQPIPADLDGYAGLIVLGGGQSVTTGAPWFAALEGLLRKAIRYTVPTLGISLGAQLLAVASAGTVERAAAGPEIGAALVAKRDAADKDPLFAPLPLIPDVVQWHRDEITELPSAAVLLCASADYPHQAFRVGEAAWGVQFHPEADTAMVARWAADNAPLLAELGRDADELVAEVDALMDDLFEVWHPFTRRFAALVRGDLAPAKPGRDLPILGS
jgi:GMP synthase-like glutamine amidotransferase